MDMSPSYEESEMEIEAWQSPVHVCRQWRSLVVFGSPRRLNFRLVCTHKSATKGALDIWPALPLVVSGDITFSVAGKDNVIAALVQSNRVCHVDLGLDIA